jgi:hypothetical protein
MRQALDRKRLRRKYIAAKMRGYASLIAGAAILLVVLSAFMIPALFGDLFRRLPVGSLPAVLIPLMMLIFLISGGIGLCLLGWLKRKANAVRDLVYVPPVTHNNLPADEILVRGSEEPMVAQSEVLLRATQQPQDTPKEELLRVSQE